MSLVNLCHFAVILAGNTIAPAVGSPLVFTPVLDESGPVARLKGFTPPADLPVLPEGSVVIVPRFAAAVGWALSAGLNPVCVPLAGVRNPQEGSFSCDSLEPAPRGLAVDFPEEFLPLDSLDAVVRAVPGPFVVQVLGGPDLGPVGAAAAIRRPDDSVYVPGGIATGSPILVPQDGKIIAAVAAEYPSSPLLVTDVVRPGSRTRLFQVR